MIGRAFDDEQNIFGRLGHFAKLRLANVEPAKKPIRSIHITELPGRRRNRLVAAQWRERFGAIQKPERYWKCYPIQIMSAKRT